MWLFTETGFYSVVEFDPERASFGFLQETPLPDGTAETYVLVRARVREHLETLIERYSPEALGTSKIYHTPGADYPFRIVVSKHAWSNVLGVMGRTIDYTNFKHRVGEQGPPLSAVEYERALYNVWLILDEAFSGWREGWER